MADQVASIGLDDIAFGVGTREVPTYGGGSRTIKEVNLGSIPFSEAKSTAQVLAEFTTLLQAKDYSAVQQHLAEITKLVSEIEAVKRVDFNSPTITTISNSLPAIQALHDKLPELLSIHPDMQELHQLNADMNHLMGRFNYIKTCIHEEIANATSLVVEKLDPTMQSAIALKTQLDSLVATVRADIISGNELVAKFGSYTLVTRATPQCRQPKIIVDDENKRIIWHIPTVKGSCTMAQPTQEQTSKAIAEYLLTHPEIGNVTLPNNDIVSVDELETPLPVVESWGYAVTRPNSDTGNLGGDIQFKLGSDKTKIMTSRAQAGADPSKASITKLVYINSNGTRFGALSIPSSFEAPLEFYTLPVGVEKLELFFKLDKEQADWTYESQMLDWNTTTNKWEESLG